MNILVVDDEKEIADLIELYLVNENYTVFKFYCMTDAIKCIKERKIDLAILDIMLPDGDGFSICKKIREEHSFPIVMLTAKDDEIDKIMGLTLGADDYITKPFRPLELIARVKAQVRRYTKYNSYSNEVVEKIDGLFIFDELMVNIKTYECRLDDKKIALTPTEFSILKILIEEKGNVVSSEQLFREIWRDEYFSKNNNTIPTHIRHIREKLNDSIEKPKYIKTVWGVGYKFEK